ncbi:MAG TPA: SprT family zinc-dependent metalloprotease [Smithellaceae bacterium]|nr:SprT family zinc-dependent metalloprotease [Smithellaceae bacterium]
MDIQYSLIRSPKRKKTVSLQIGNQSEITVQAPVHTPAAEIRRFVEEKQAWIEKSLRRQATLQASHPKKAYETGETFYYLGEACFLEAFFDPLEYPGVVFRSNCFFLNCPPDRQMRKHYLAAWYRQQARSYLTRRVDFYKQRLGLTPGGLRITSAEKRWGSCSEKNHLSFAFRLIMAPPQAVDYVVVHEMMHIREKNHSSKFWNLVLEVIPDYKMQRLWLREHQRDLDL